MKMNADCGNFGFSIEAAKVEIEQSWCKCEAKVAQRYGNKEMIEMNTFLKLFMQNTHIANNNPKI